MLLLCHVWKDTTLGPSTAVCISVNTAMMYVYTCKGLIYAIISMHAVDEFVGAI
jgi:hypothetical protein